MKTPRKIEPDYVIEVDVYHVDVGVFYSREKLDKWLEQAGLDLDTDRQAFNAFVLRDRDKEGVTWFCAYLPKVIKIHTLAHECVHLANLILDQAGVQTTATNDEALAYLVDHLVREVDLNSGRIVKGSR